MMKTEESFNEEIGKFRKGIYSLEEVLSKVPVDTETHSSGRKHKVEFDGDPINMAVQTYKVFKKFGVKCVECGIEGKYFIKERLPNQTTYHFTLYAVDEQGKEISMTKDHRVPIAKGGGNHLTNLQPMCWWCNHKKGKNAKKQDFVNYTLSVYSR